MEPLVTIAIASHNNANYIKKCIDSILNQSYSNIEIILVDDGSLDNTDEIIKHEYLDKVCYIKKENGGLSSAREAALRCATGEYICFVDADDFCGERYIENMVRAIVNDSADICVCGTVFLDMEGKVLKELTKAFSFKEKITTIRIETEMLQSKFSYINGLYKTSDSWNKLYNRGFITRNDVHFLTPKGYNGTDSSFNKRLMFSRPVVTTVQSCDYYHVMYEHSAVHRKNKKLQVGMQIMYEQLENEAKRKGVYHKIKTQLASFYYGSLRDSIEDVYNESTTDHMDVFANLSKMLDSHENFSTSHSITRLTNENFSNSINSFIKCLETKNVNRLIMHIRIRRLFLNMLSIWNKLII